MKRYATIDYKLLRESGLSINEWLLLDLIYFYSNNEYRACYASKKKLSENLGLSDRNVYRLIDALIKKGFIIKNELSHLVVTEKYINLITFTNECEEPEYNKNECDVSAVGMTKCQSGYDKMSVDGMTKCQSPSIKKEYIREKEKKEEIVVEVDDDLPIPKKLFDEFIEHRKKIKSPMSEIAKKKFLNKLRALKDEGYDVEALVEESIINGWRGIFPKDEYRIGRRKLSSKVAKNLDDIMKMDLNGGAL